MNEDHRRRDFTCSKLLTAAAFVTFLMYGNMVIAESSTSDNLTTTNVEQQQRTAVSGTIVDATGTPIIGASIHE